MPSIADRVDALFSKWDVAESPGCVLAVIKDGEFIHKRSYGMADLERSVSLTPEFRFDIGSIGKQFTATVIAILANQGLLDLDNPIRRYLPEMFPYADQITIRHLVHHTSGLRDYLTLMDLSGMADENIYAEDFLLELIVRQSGLNFKPGREYLYSNSGYFLLGIIAQRVTGKHITKLIQEYILDPLEMKNTTFNKDPRPVVKKRAMSYDEGEREGTFVNSVALSGGYGDGAIITNVDDLLLWDRNFYDNKLNNAQPDLMEQLHETGRLNNGKKITYAFGLTVDAHRGHRIVMHGGSWAGYRAEMMRFPGLKFSSICLSNLGIVNPTRLCLEIADIFLADVLKPKQNPDQRQIPETNNIEFKGIYQNKYLTIEIYERNGTLFIFNGWPEKRLKSIGKKQFRLEGTPDTVSFSGAHNQQLTYNEYGEGPVKTRRILGSRQTPLPFDLYEGEYFNRDLDIQYTLIATGDGLLLKRTPFDNATPLHVLADDLILCKIGELRFHIKDGTIKGFTLNADRALNLRFRRKR